MFINKIEETLLKELQSTIKNMISSWYRIPDDLDVNNLNVIRIRYVKKWRNEESAYIVEFKTDKNYYRKLISESELSLSVEHFKELIEEENKNYILFAKSFLVNTEWYEYPVIWGELDSEFDILEHYADNGKYQPKYYKDFESLYS